MTHQEILQTFPLAVSLIKAEEGFRSTPYKCTSGAWTVGFGTNLDARGLPHEGVQWTEAEAEDSLLEELVDIVAALDARYPRWRELLNPAREAAVLSACCQLGMGGAAAFHDTIAAIRAQDWKRASDCLMRSRWAKQTPGRVGRNSAIMFSGQLPEVVNDVRILPSQADSGMDQAQNQPAASVLPPSRLPASGPSSPLPLPPVRDVASPVPLTVGGVVLSKKLCVAIVAFLAVILNEPLHIGMDYGTCKELVTLACSYIMGQAGVDAFKPIVETLLKSGGKPHA